MGDIQGAGVHGDGAKNHPAGCLDGDITRHLFNRMGLEKYEALTEKDLIYAMRDLIVKKRNNLVNRQKLNNIIQGPEEPVQMFEVNGQYVSVLDKMCRGCLWEECQLH